jgi:thymidylate kinase
MNLIIIRGPGGAGKSTVAEHLAELLRETRKVAVIGSDTFYWGISGVEKDEDLVYEGMARLAEMYLQYKYDVIIEGILSSKDNEGLRIRNIISIAENLNAKVTLFYLNVSFDESKKRIGEKFRREGWPYSEEETLVWFKKSQDNRLENEIEIDSQKNNIKSVCQDILRRIK